MVQPDPHLFRPVMGLRYAIIVLMLIVYTLVMWQFRVISGVLAAEQYAVVSGILAAEAVLGAILYFTLSPKHNGLLVHLSLLSDILATSGLILCTGLAGSTFPLFYMLIVLAAGLLYGRSTGINYWLVTSLVYAAVFSIDHYFPLYPSRLVSDKTPYMITAAIVPAVAFQMLLVVGLAQRGRYLQALYKNVSDGLLILDETGQIVEANDRAAQMTGRSRLELVGMTLEELAGETAQGHIVTREIRRCMDGKAVSFEMGLEKKAGEPLPVEINAQRVAGLSPTRIQAFARDISARRQMEAEIRRQNAELRRINQELQVGRDLALNASRMKSQLLANMSHELRTPLNSIIGYTQFVLGDSQRPLGEEQKEDLSRVLHAARHLLELINGLLDLARIESGRESLRISRFELRELADTVLDAMAPMAREKGIELGYSVDPDLPELQTDEKKLRQVLFNLLANAVNFTEGGEVRIDCRGNGDQSVCIAVSDTGIGIPDDQLDAIFSEFHQVDSTAQKPVGGTGLGLAIAKRVVDLLGGTIEVQSEVGRGSTFTLTIPMILEPRSPDTQAARARTPEEVQ